MLKKSWLSTAIIIKVAIISAQEKLPLPVLYSYETSVHIGQIVKNSPQAPTSNPSVIYEFNLSTQTSGKNEWNALLGFPKAGCSFFLGNLGNKKDLGNFAGLLPNMTFNTINPKWYIPRINLGLGIAYFNNPYNQQKNTSNFYIGSAITAFGYASVYVQPRINNLFSLKTGISVMHCSNGHVQIPNLGINLPTIFIGFIYTPLPIPSIFNKRNITIPQSRIHFAIRAGIGVHELAKTTEPIGTPKFAVYTTDFYLSKRFGTINNLQLGLELRHYNSYYNYIKNNNFYSNNRKLKSTVAGIFVAHELIIHKISLLSMAGINIYNPFYAEYMKQYKSQRGLNAELKKYIFTSLGLQYYLRDPHYCSRSNIFIGAYVKANFGQADFVCSQIGFIF
jgi:hypothetical protein